MGTGHSKTGLINSRNVALPIAAFEDLEGLNSLRKKTIVTGSCGNASNGKCSLGGDCGTLDSKVVFCYLRQCRILH